MNAFRNILLFLSLTACIDNTKVEHQSIVNQISLNGDRNNQRLHLIRRVVEDSGNRTLDLRLLDKAQGIFQLKSELKIDNLDFEYHNNTGLQMVQTYLDTLTSRFDELGNDQANIQIAKNLLKSSRGNEHQFYHLMLQISYVEVMLIESYSQFCIADVNYDSTKY